MNRVPFDQLMCLAAKEDASPAQRSAFKTDSLAMFKRNGGKKENKLQRIENLEQSLKQVLDVLSELQHEQQVLFQFSRSIQFEHDKLKKNHKTLEAYVNDVKLLLDKDRANMVKQRRWIKECMHEIEDLYKAHGGNYQPFPKNSSAHASDSDEDEE